MEESHGGGKAAPGFIANVYDRLRDSTDYIWDETRPPFQNSYDNWHVFARKRISRGANVPSVRGRPHHFRSNSQSDRRQSSVPPDEHEESKVLEEHQEANSMPVVLRISNNTLRLERQYQLSRALIAESDPLCQHIARPLECFRLPPRHAREPPLTVVVIQALGGNYLKDIGTLSDQLNLNYSGSHKAPRSDDPIAEVPLVTFLEFAIGATECLEILHHGKEPVVHGELRADAFHYNHDTGAVRLVNFGSGVRAFEHGLTSAGWSSLSRDPFARNKLYFIAPEQTGRMPAAPDSRTDIYSLGVLFWALLAGELPFDGKTPLEIMQNVLNRRIPAISSKRLDVPHALSSVIQKMTQKALADRYQSTSGLKWDLQEIQKLMREGDADALRVFSIGTKDVSCFFHLPNSLVGRSKERDAIIALIEKVSHHQKQTTRDVKEPGPSRMMSSTVSTSVSRADPEILDENKSITSGSMNSASRAGSPILDKSRGSSLGNGDVEPAKEANGSMERASALGSKLSLNSRSSFHGKGVMYESEALTRSSSHQAYLDDGAGSLLRNKQKFSIDRVKHKSRCEICLITGSAGMGKSCLVQSVQSFVRARGYFASAKLDQAKRSPFEAILGMLSSLLRQIFAESDVHSDFHRGVRDYVRPVWPLLHSMLELPRRLLEADLGPMNESISEQLVRSTIEENSHPLNASSTERISKVHCGGAGATCADFFGSGSMVKSSRLLNTILDILRFIGNSRFVCAHFDDVHNLDEDNFETLRLIATSNIPILLLITYRHEDSWLAKLRTSVTQGSASVTRVHLGPLDEEDAFKLVMATLHSTREVVEPLTKYLLKKTSGNPFFMRELLENWYRKGAIWFSHRTSRWDYDLGRASSEFDKRNCGSHTSNDFIIKRLEDLPVQARSLLAWASLLGSTFSFNLVKQLMLTKEGGAEKMEAKGPISPVKRTQLIRHTSSDAVAGLNAALAAHVIVPGQEEDQFCFSHDRFLEASASLPSALTTEEKHFVIAQTVAADQELEDAKMFMKARHICKATELIKRKISERSLFRGLLYRAAEKAAESGARTTALKFFNAALFLLQDDPWDESFSDVRYEETLVLYIKAAECRWYLGFHDQALELVSITFKRARNAVDRAPSWLLQSRIYAQQGDSHRAFGALKACLSDLGIKIESSTWEKCDTEFRELSVILQSIDCKELLARPLTSDRVLTTIGPILIDMLSAAFWSDSLLFYQMTLVMLRIHLERGTVVQMGVCYVHMASVAIGRFGMLEFGLDMGNLARDLLAQTNDAHTVGRGETLRSVFCGHYQTHIKEQLPLLERAMDATMQAGDKILSLLNLGIVAATRLWASFDMDEVEAFAQFAPEEFVGWQQNLRGGSFLIGVRQFCRAMQGKTGTDSASSVLDDEEHQTQNYIQSLIEKASAPDRPMTIYRSYLLAALFHYGHFKDAVQLGENLVLHMKSLWCMRNNAMILWYLALSHIAVLRERPSKVEEGGLKAIEEYRRQLALFEGVNNVNYFIWTSLLDAELDDLTGNREKAMEQYEVALDHAEMHEFRFEGAMAFELYGEWTMRRGARRLGRGMIQEAVAAYERVGATGKAKQLFRRHESLLRATIGVNTVDVGCQVTIVDTNDSGFNLDPVGEENLSALGDEPSQDRTAAWVGPKTSSSDSKTAENDAVMGLDIIDMTSILDSFQALSSTLQVDVLLPKMMEIILESSGAESSGIIVQDDDVGWRIAAVGHNKHGITSYPLGKPLEQGEQVIAKQVTTYALRFREVVFVNNLLEDERFSHVSDTWLQENPNGKAVIAIPIIRGNDLLLGCLYVQAEPNSLTDRNLSVLRLLTNQIGISIANALLFKKLEKARAENLVIIDSQKRALAQVREALRLKEEAMQAKTVFLANTSHELRTPLNGVIGMSQLLLGTALSSEQTSYAESIRVCADTLLQVINDILDFSKLEAGKMQIFAVRMNLVETIQEVVRAVSFTNPKPSVKTVKQVELDPKLYVTGDPVRLHQIFMNLLSNAYKFTNEGTVTVRAVTDWEDADTVLATFSVADTGVGIPDATRTKLFQPFSQADSSTARNYGGTGLGLSICKAIIENLMRGRIWMDSTPGAGTTVSFQLKFSKAVRSNGALETPVADKADPIGRIPEPSEDKGVESSAESSTEYRAELSAESDEEGTAESSVESTAEPSKPESPLMPQIIDLASIPRDQIRVCICEDNPINSKIATSFVDKLGFECAAFADGRQGVAALENASTEGNPFHLVLMDVQMPVLDGYSATREIRRHKDPQVRQVLVIALTASAIQGDREKCLEAGMNDYLTKPIRLQVLKRMLEAYVEKGANVVGGLNKQHGGVTNGVAKGKGPDGEGKNETETKKKKSKTTRELEDDEAVSEPNKFNSQQEKPGPMEMVSGATQTEASVTNGDTTESTAEKAEQLPNNDRRQTAFKIPQLHAAGDGVAEEGGHSALGGPVLDTAAKNDRTIGVKN